MVNEPNEDDEQIEFDFESTQVTIEWAMATAAMIIMLSDVPEPETPEQAQARLIQLEEGLELMHGTIPDFMYGFANAYAYHVIEEEEAEEELIQQFKEELDKYGN